MSECNFSVKFAGSADEVYAKAKAAIEKQGGNFNGDTNAGCFDVSFFGSSVAGNYTVAGEELQVVIHSKPFMIPCAAIESFLAKQIA
jgi:hypothetical protein